MVCLLSPGQFRMKRATPTASSSSGSSFRVCSSRQVVIQPVWHMQLHSLAWLVH